VGKGHLWVEAWSPEYGASFDVTMGIDSTEEEVAPFVETEDWSPMSPAASEWPAAAFIDGVSRVDARAFLDSGSQTIPGLCGSVGIGVVYADQPATFGPYEVHRSAVFGAGQIAEMPTISQALNYTSRSVPGSRADELRHGLEGLRAEVEAEMARKIAREGRLVIADGALGVLEPLEVVGFIKSHQRAYLGPELEPVVRALGPGERTPLFSFGVIRPRYSWYLRLAASEGEHPWAAIARCEVTASLSLERAREIADLTAFHLPRFASKPHWDARAPQNLVPIATLERRLWHLLGDRELVYRKIRSALSKAA
jgi:hypothetical protein